MKRIPTLPVPMHSGRPRPVCPESSLRRRLVEARLEREFPERYRRLPEAARARTAELVEHLRETSDLAWHHAAGRALSRAEMWARYTGLLPSRVREGPRAA